MLTLQGNYGADPLPHRETEGKSLAQGLPAGDEAEPGFELCLPHSDVQLKAAAGMGMRVRENSLGANLQATDPQGHYSITVTHME